MKINNEDCIYISKLFSHASTITGELLVSLKSQAKLVISPTLKSPSYVFQAINEYSVTTICLNPTLLKMYTNEVSKKEYSLPSLKTIYINDIDIRDISTESIHKCTSIMFQDYINYSFSLKDNLLYSDIWNIHTEKDLINACKAGNSFSFVNSWDNGLDSYLTKTFDIDGKELSGGQWQSIALSRAFVKKAQMFIFDEPSAALDIEAEQQIYKELIFNHRKEILILISHRMSYMKDMTKIIVIDNGELSELGTHDELIKKDGIYHKMYNIKIEKS